MVVVITPMPAPPEAVGLDLSDDYVCWDGIQEIWIQRREDNSSFYIEKAVLVSSEGVGSGVDVLYNRVVEKEISNGVYLEHYGTWKVPNNLLSTDGILPGDYVIDSVQGVIWTILKVNSPRHNDPWDFQCNSLTFNLPFASTIDYYGVEAEKDDYGGRVINKELAYEELKAAIQPITSGESTADHKRIFFNTEFYCYLDGDIEAAVGDILSDEDGDWFEVLNIEDRQRIDTYMRLIIKRIVQPDELN